MSRKTWLLVEWVDEENVFPKYDVVNSNYLINEEMELHPGKIIYVRVKNGNSARQAQVLRISEDKQQVKEHKALLERQDFQVKNMLSLCMRTIKEMKTDPMLYGGVSNQSMNAAGSSNAVLQPQYVTEHNSSDGDSDNETSNTARIPQLHKTLVETPAKYKSYIESTLSSLSKQKRRLVSSTPLPCISPKCAPTLTFDQGTQTDIEVPSSAEKIEQMEIVLNHLHRKFLALVDRLQLNAEQVYDFNEDNETAEFDGGNNIEEKPVVEHNLNDSRAEVEDLRRIAKLQVRRVSAQTTNTVDPSLTMADRNGMMPLGSGNATVPVRVMNEINWDSYTSATRQLLQAIFPRKVLATHSLTGKPSPAFVNKPAKKCLDPKLIEDIIETVSERCGVPKRSVRNCITIKCTDEAKLYRNRLQGRNSNQGLVQSNQENVPPSPEKSRASSND